MERRSWPWRSKKTTHKLQKTSPVAAVASLSSSLSVLIPPPAHSLKRHAESPPADDGHHCHQDASIQAELHAKTQEALLSQRDQAEQEVKVLSEKLRVAAEEATAKEDLVKQHSKVAEEAIAGWEKAEAEAASLKQELEASLQQRMMVEDRAEHLDGALKECMRQVRLAKEEQQSMIEEAIQCKTQEWNMVRAEFESKQAELTHRLMSADAENSAMAKSLQERAKTIAEIQEARVRAETEVRVLQVKMESLEKEISALKYELHVLNKELEIRTEEREVNRKAADAAHKQHLENAKKIAKLEAECQRLRGLVKKKLPGPAALAQMRMEVEGFGREGHHHADQAQPKSLRRKASMNKSAIHSSLDNFQQELRGGSTRAEIEMLTERMVAMEEETKLLKESLAKRNAELLASRQLCARTVNKLSAAEDNLQSLQGTPRQGCKIASIDVQSELSFSENGGGEDDEEASCAESWASALITELAQFSKTPKSPHSPTTCQYNHQSMDSPCSSHQSIAAGHNVDASSPVNVDRHCQQETAQPKRPHERASSSLDMIDNEVAQQGIRSSIDVLNSSDQPNKNTQELHMSEPKVEFLEENDDNRAVVASSAGRSLPLKERKVLKIVASKEQELQKANLMCKDLKSGLALMEDKLRSLKSSVSTLSPVASPTGEGGPELNLAVLEESLKDAVHAHELLGKLDKVLDEMRIAVASLEDTDSEPEDNRVVANVSASNMQNDRANQQQQKSSTLIEPSSINNTPLQAANLGFVFCKLILMLDMLQTPLALSSHPHSDAIACNEPKGCIDESLVNAKDRFLIGKATAMEFLLRFAIVLSGLCRVESVELEGLLAKEISIGGGVGDDGKADDNGGANNIDMLQTGCNHYQNEIQLVKDEKAAVEKQLSATLEDLQRSERELAEAKVSIQGLLAQSQDEKSKLLLDEEGRRAELQNQLEKSQVEVGKLQKSVAHLTIELADQKQVHEAVSSRCEALEQKVKGYEMEKEQRHVHEEDVELRKEKEVAAAKEKLAECQRTILVLGKQLTALTSSSAPPSHPPTTLHSRGVSFDSLDSTPFDRSAEYNHLPLDEQTLPGANGHHRRRQSGNGVAASQSWRLDGHHYHHRNYSHYPPPHHHHQHMYADGEGPHYSNHRANGAYHQPPAAADVYLQDDIGSGRYTSPTDTTLSSPPASPPTIDDRRNHRHSSRSSHRHRAGNATIRTSLASTMEAAAAANAQPPITPPSAKPPKPGSSSSFSKFFTRSSRNHNR